MMSGWRIKVSRPGPKPYDNVMSGMLDDQHTRARGLEKEISRWLAVGLPPSIRKLQLTEVRNYPNSRMTAKHKAVSRSPRESHPSKLS